MEIIAIYTGKNSASWVQPTRIAGFGIYKKAVSKRHEERVPAGMNVP